MLKFWPTGLTCDSLSSDGGEQRDYDAKYMTAVAMIDDDNYLGIDQSFNMFTVSDILHPSEAPRVTDLLLVTAVANLSNGMCCSYYV